MEDFGRVGAEVVITWRGRKALAWVPAPLELRDLTLSPSALRASTTAVVRARQASEAFPPSWHVLGRLLLRTEGAASSAIEGIRASPVQLAFGDLDPLRTSAGDVEAVFDNLRCLTAALDHAADPTRPLRLADLLEWHRILMASSSLPEPMVGVVRAEQGWIGGTSPLDAAVTPPPELLAELLDDLLRFSNADPVQAGRVDAVSAAAIVHAQFELIHPFADGNGRLGRVLLLWVLMRHLHLLQPPPVSALIERQRGAYLAGLQQFRLGMVSPWVQWCSEAVSAAADHVDSVRTRLDIVQADWVQRAGAVRADATATSLLGALVEHPVIHAKAAATLCSVSTRAGLAALRQLEALGIVEPIDPSSFGRPATPTRGRPQSRWIAAEVFAALRW